MPTDHCWPIAEILDREEITAEITAFLAGSLVEGLGNSWSDLDVYVLSDREPVGSVVACEGGATISIHYVDDQRIDYEFWPLERVRELGRKLRSFSIGDGQVVSIFSETEELFIHRLTGKSICISGEINRWQDQFDRSKLAFYQAQMSIRRLDGLHEDVCGMLDAGDWHCAAFVAREMVSASLDAYLHSLGNTNPTRKWRPKLIEKFTKGGEDPCVTQFYELQFPANLVARSTADELRAYVKSCIAYQARVVRGIHRA